MSEEVTAWATRGRMFDRLPANKAHAVLGTGAADIAAARQAIAAASGSKAFAMDPELVDRMIKKLTEISDEVGQIRRNGQILSQDTKLGDGYARVISTNNSDFGKIATQHVVDILREIGALKEQIEKSRASYQNADQSHADSLKKLNGKS